MEITSCAGLTVVLGALPILIWLLWWWNDLWYVLLPTPIRVTNTKSKLPPGHMGFPVIGELLGFIWYFKFLKRPDDFIESKRKRYGDGIGVYRTHLFGSPSIISCSPSLNRFVFQSDSLFPYRFPTNDLVGPTSLLAIHGSHHKRVRGYVATVVAQPAALRDIALRIQPRIAAALHSWAEKGAVVASEEVKKLFFETTAELFVSFEPGPLLDEIGRYYVGLLEGFNAQPINIPGTKYYHAVQCRKKIVKIFKMELEKRKQEQSCTSTERKKDLIDVLQQIKDDEGKQLSDAEVLDNIVTLFLGGFETTAAVATWALFFLAKNPNVLQKLWEENMSLSRIRNGELITFDEISQLSYTKKVVEETLRMANISSFIFRSGDLDVEYQGYLIPKGWKVILWVCYLHRSSNYYDDPEIFNPDRWDSSKPEAFQTFGGGSMMCVGAKLARMELIIFLHYLVVGYKWELMNPNTKITCLPYPRAEDGVKIAMTRI